MSLILAAILSGTDPQGPLPPGAFHRTLEDQIVCPRCSATYNLVADYDHAASRFFAEDSRKPILLLKKAIRMGHENHHRVTHFETSGVTVRAITANAKP